MKHLILALMVSASPVGAAEIQTAEIATLPPVDVVFLGEVHDNPWHHQNQAAMVSAIRPRAVVFEMLTADQADLVTPALIAQPEALARVLRWADSGWPDFAMYAPIFQAAGQAEIYGAQVPRAEVRRAIMGDDVAAVFGAEAAQYGLTKALPVAEQAEREAEQMAAHCDALPETMLPGMVFGQRLRDAALARAVDRAYDRTGGPVVVITGNGHARVDRGAPVLVSPALSLRSIGQLEAPPEAGEPYDDWIVTPAASRPDPCLAFKKG